MTDYLTRLTENPAFRPLAGLKPDGICPYLYYNIAPYVYTLINNGWFAWVRRSENPAVRRPAVIRHPEQNKTNRLFVNEVLVRCPHPETTVIAGVGPEEHQTTMVRILHVDGDCPCQHLPEERFLLPPEAGEQALSYGRLFTERLLQAMTAVSLEKAVMLFDGDTGAVSCDTIRNPCRYHPRPVRYDARRLLPGNCCPHVFARIYPQVLAVMYGAEVDNVQTVPAPGNKGSLKLKIEKTPANRAWPWRIISNAVDTAFSRLFHPLDRIDYTLAVKVLSADPGETGGMRPGDCCDVNLKSPAYLCPAGFYSLYPYLLLAAAGGKMAWSESGTNLHIPCPDCAGVVYDIHPDIS